MRALCPLLLGSSVLLVFALAGRADADGRRPRFEVRYQVQYKKSHSSPWQSHATFTTRYDAQRSLFYLVERSERGPIVDARIREFHKLVGGVYPSERRLRVKLPRNRPRLHRLR